VSLPCLSYPSARWDNDGVQADNPERRQLKRPSIGGVVHAKPLTSGHVVRSWCSKSLLEAVLSSTALFQRQALGLVPSNIDLRRALERLVKDRNPLSSRTYLASLRHLVCL
jgi:hypothetical protein